MSNRALVDLARPFIATVLLFEESEPAARASASSLQADLNRYITEIRNEAKAQGIHGDEIDEACFALSAWADEIVMADHDRQSDWFEKQLQFTGFGVRDAGSQFYTRLEALRPDFHRARWVFALCLAFGFGGRYARNPEERQKRLRNALNEIENQEETPTGRLSPQAYSISGTFSPPRVVGLRHIAFRWTAVLSLVLLGLTALLAVFVYRVPGAN